MMSIPLFQCVRVDHIEEVTNEVDSRHMKLRTLSCGRRLKEDFQHNEGKSNNRHKSTIRHVGEFHEGINLKIK
jgi:hypothetical protein